MTTHEQYVRASIRLEELINIVTDEMSESDPLVVEFLEITELIENYEQKHYSIGLPSLREVIELRMFEMKIKQKELATLLGTSASRISEYLSGKREITLSIARALHRKLNIDSDIVLQ